MLPFPGGLDAVDAKPGCDLGIAAFHNDAVAGFALAVEAAVTHERHHPAGSRAQMRKDVLHEKYADLDLIVRRHDVILNCRCKDIQQFRVELISE